MLSNQLVDGYIVTPLKGLEKDIENITTDGKPVVLIDGYFPSLSIPHVLVDNYNSVLNAVQSLIGQGYKNIAYVTPDLDLIQLEDRMMGYTDAIKAGGIKENKKNICRVPFGCEREETIAFVKEYLKSNKKIDAVFFSTNYLGAIGLQSINELKLKIPDDLAVISFDDTELFELYPPGITAVKQPTYDIAKSAIDLLLSRLKNDELDISGIKMQIPADLIKRGSTTR